MDFNACVTEIELMAGSVVEVTIFGADGDLVAILHGVLQRSVRAPWPEAAKEFANPESAAVEFDVGSDATTFALWPDRFESAERRSYDDRIVFRAPGVTYVIGPPSRPWTD